MKKLYNHKMQQMRRVYGIRFICLPVRKHEEKI